MKSWAWRVWIPVRRQIEQGYGSQLPRGDLPAGRYPGSLQQLVPHLGRAVADPTRDGAGVGIGDGQGVSGSIGRKRQQGFGLQEGSLGSRPVGSEQVDFGELAQGQHQGFAQLVGARQKGQGDLPADFPGRKKQSLLGRGRQVGIVGRGGGAANGVGHPQGHRQRAVQGHRYAVTLVPGGRCLRGRSKAQPGLQGGVHMESLVLRANAQL